MDGWKDAGAPVPPIEIKMTIEDSLNYAMSRNSIPIVSDLLIANNTEKTLTNVRAVITSDPEFLIEKTIRFDRIEPNTFVEESLLRNTPAGTIRLNANFLANMTERVSGHVNVDVLSNDDLLASESFEISVLAFDEWPGVEYAGLISAFITPNDPLLAQVRSRASDILRSSDRSGSLNGYQSNDRLRVKEVVAAIYIAIKQLNINYVNPPASFEKYGQRIRLPRDVLNRKEGTCIDMSILFASVLESVGLNPLIIFVHGHAFAGAWLEESSFPDIVTFDCADISRRVRDDTMCVVECTATTSDKNVDFSSACSMAFRRLSDMEFDRAVDVKRSRTSIMPLPIMANIDGKWVIQREESKAEEKIELSVKPKYDRPDKKEETKVDFWERKLLDTSTRNNLVNVRFTKKMIPLMVGDLSKLMSLVENGKSFQLYPKPQEWSGYKNYEAHPHECEKYLENCNESSISDMDKRIVRTPLTDAELQSNIVTLSRESKKNMEESGSYSLYVAIGALKWYEDNSSPKYAPLILLPISIERQSLNRYVINAVDDEIMFNTTLLEKLRNEYKINLSNVDPLPENFKIDQIFDWVLNDIAGMKGWDVIRSAYLGIFSFNQFVMWRDLRAFRDKLSQNKLVKSLMESQKTWDAGNIDEDSGPYDLCLTVPADSSQIRAVKAAGNGKTFVLHGPPGTGKSQTITNMISNAIYHGKTVLFVAEKIAALDVVDKRLNSIGIGEHCLKLHSNKAQKKIFLDQIKAALQKDVCFDHHGRENNLMQLENARNDLNEYAQALHRRKKCGMSIYEIISEFESINEDGLFEIPISEKLLSDYTSDDHYNVCNGLEKLIGFSNNVELSPLNPLRCVRLSELSADLEDDFSARIRELGDITQDILDLSDSLAGFDLHVDPLNPRSLEELLKDVDAVDLKILDDHRSDEQGDAVNTIVNGLITSEPLLKDLCASSTNGAKTIAQSIVNSYHTIKTAYGTLRSFGYSLDLRTVDEHLKELDTISRNYNSVSADVEDMDKTWKPSIADSENINEEWANANNKGFFGRKGAKKRFMELISRHLYNLNATFESIPNMLVPVNRLISVISDTKRSTKDYLSKRSDSELKREIAELNDFREKILTNARILQKYELDRKGLADLCRFVNDNRNSVERLSELSIRKGLFADEFASLFEIDNKMINLNDHMPCKTFCDNLSKKTRELADWVNWNAQCEKMNDMNLGSAVCALYDGVDRAKLIPSFLKCFYKSLAKVEIKSSKTLSSFNMSSFESTLEKFKELDRKYTEMNRKVLISRLRSKIPARSGNSQHSSQVRELYTISERQTVRRSIRKLFELMPDILPMVFPCMLMSPLSASQYYAAGSPKFDIVIFDEASQIPTEKAIGAVARGRSTVIVGDSKQLPPTSFFETKTDYSEDYEEFGEDAESFLEECLGLPLPDTRLEWHYRSKHESLIAFSNRKYYGNNMLTFPSPNDLETKVSLVMVNGEYEKGGLRINRKEARAVVGEIERRLGNRPEQSIGVVAFSKAQQDCIEDELDQKTKSNPKLYDLINNREEPLFIKNLETVQGDERDVILFSIGYGRDANGKVSMNFGPINKPGGQKRLNVAVSRAREEMVVFSSMSVEDMRVRPETPEGVKNLRDFIEYASKGGTFYDKEHARNNSSGIPRSMARELKELGYRTHFNVGHSKFHVDLAVVDPSDDKRYLLGILCDGKSYLDPDKDLGGDARNANVLPINDRDREYARVEFLKKLGWNVIRISPIDWFTRKERVMDLIKKRIDDVLPVAVESDEIEHPAEVGTSHQESEVVEYVRKVYEPAYLKNKNISLSVALGDPWIIEDTVSDIIETEGPIMEALLLSRIDESFSVTRQSLEDKKKIIAILNNASLKTTVDHRGQKIYWKKHQTPLGYREYRAIEGNSSIRPISKIPVDELVNALLDTSRSNGKSGNELFQETCEKLGYVVTEHAKYELLCAFNYAVANGKLEDMKKN